jgi:hypothetical protein
MEWELADLTESCPLPRPAPVGISNFGGGDSKIPSQSFLGRPYHSHTQKRKNETFFISTTVSMIHDENSKRGDGETNPTDDSATASVRACFPKLPRHLRL